MSDQQQRLQQQQQEAGDLSRQQASYYDDEDDFGEEEDLIPDFNGAGGVEGGSAEGYLDEAQSGKSIASCY